MRLIITCVATKSKPSKSSLRDCNREDLDTCYDEFMDYVSDDVDTLPAVNMYSGNQWELNKELMDMVDETYIISAGMGLIKPSTHIPSYAATFNTRAQDSVVRNNSDWSGDMNRRWWNKLSDGILRGLLNDDTDTLFIASPPYLKAVRDDIPKTLPNNKIIVGGKNSYPNNTIITEKKLLDFFGGNQIQMNSKMGKWVLKQGISCSNTLIQEMDLIRGSIAPYPKQKASNKSTLSTDSMLEYIALCKQQQMGKGLSLKRLQTFGYGCGSGKWDFLWNS